jgi:hypothetical protein
LFTSSQVGRRNSLVLIRHPPQAIQFPLQASCFPSAAGIDLDFPTS